VVGQVSLEELQAPKLFLTGLIAASEHLSATLEMVAIFHSHALLGLLGIEGGQGVGEGVLLLHFSEGGLSASAEETESLCRGLLDFAGAVHQEDRFCINLLGLRLGVGHECLSCFGCSGGHLADVDVGHRLSFDFLEFYFMIICRMGGELNRYNSFS